MANMIDKYDCPGCGKKHKIKPYLGYRVAIDFGDGPEQMALVISKVVPDGGGGLTLVVLDVRTRPVDDVYSF